MSLLMIRTRLVDSIQRRITPKEASSRDSSRVNGVDDSSRP